MNTGNAKNGVWVIDTSKEIVKDTDPNTVYPGTERATTEDLEAALDEIDVLTRTLEQRTGELETTTTLLKYAREDRTKYLVASEDWKTAAVMSWVASLVMGAVAIVSWLS